MERIRKWMTIMAIAGTVLVTAVFCYMPFREIIKDKNKKTASLEQEETIGDSGDSGEELKENMTQVSEESSKIPAAGEKEPESSLAEDSRSEGTPGVSFEVKCGEDRLQTALWQNEEGICYVFLPGFAKEEGLQVDEIESGGYFTIGRQSFQRGDIIEEIAWEEAYEFALYNDENEQVLKAPLIFMHSSDLPVLALSTESESMDFIHEEKGNREPGEVLLFDEEGQTLYQGEAESISGRGNSTWGLSKKPYQFKLKESADLFGFGKSKSWNLLADGYDETKLRNQIAFGLADALEMAYTPEGKAVDVYCNGMYYGIYYLCEKVQAGENRVDIADLEANTSAVYTEAELENLEIIVSEDGMRKWTGSQVEERELTGGYLFERELPGRYEQEVSGFVTSQGDIYAIQSPKYATENQVNYIADKMQEFQDAVEAEDGINKETGKHYSDYIDVDSFVRKYLMEEVTKNYDGGVTSSFFYKPEDSVSTKIFAGPVWDYDVAFGNCNLDEIVSDPMGITMLNDHVLGTDVFARLYEKEEFYEKTVSMYRQKVLPYLTYLLEEGIDTLSEKTKQAVKLDSIRWESLENRYQYYESYENDIEYLKYYIDARKNFLNDVWLFGVEYHSVTFIVDGEAWKRLYVEDGDTAGREPIPSRYNSLFMGWLTESHDVPYDEYKPVYEDMTFYAIWQELPEEEVVITSGEE